MLRRWLISVLGGYPDFESALTAVKKNNDMPAKNLLITEAVKKMFNTIGADDILRQDLDTGLYMFQDRPLSEADMISLKEDARILRGMKLWRVLKLDIKYQLNKKLFEESKITEDILWGKLMTFYDDIIRTRLQKLK